MTGYEDTLGNRLAEDGVSRCDCGCKYFEDDRCIDCGDRFEDGCPAGGRHTWAERETWDHRIRVGCDECGATP